jgi:hypothetical protein
VTKKLRHQRWNFKPLRTRESTFFMRQWGNFNFKYPAN